MQERSRLILLFDHPRAKDSYHRRMEKGKLRYAFIPMYIQFLPILSVYVYFCQFFEEVEMKSF